MLSVPIYDGGQREGRIGESRSLLQQEEIKLALVKNQVIMELREALVTLSSAIGQHKIAKDGLKAAVTEMTLARERTRVLSSNTLELSNALFSLVRARDNMIDALFRVGASRVNLARALGNLEQLREPAYGGTTTMANPRADRCAALVSTKETEAACRVDVWVGK
jgi:outer membrane protein TolC